MLETGRMSAWKDRVLGDIRKKHYLAEFGKIFQRIEYLS
jgi:hypothetical protein